MSKSVEAPQQYKQPSRKGKKAWRKHVDVSDVQEGLQLVREAEVKGGLISEKPSEELFAFDVTGSTEIRKVYHKQLKPLKSNQILAQRSAIPAVDSRKRANSKVTDGVIEPKTKKHKADWVGRKEWLRLKQVARNSTSVDKNESDPIYDPWVDTKDELPFDDPKFDFLEKPKPIVTPSTLRRAPISLAVNGKPVPAIVKPHAGTSYNPVFEDWDILLTQEGQKEVEAEKKRIEEAKKERHTAVEDYDDETCSNDESAWEGFESEYEKPELSKKRPERKTPAQRNKIKRRKEAERKAKWEAQMKKRRRQSEQIKAISIRVQAEEESRKKLREQTSGSSDEGDDCILRRRPLGKNFPPPKPLELVLPEELQDSLRLLKPEGNLLDDRFRSLIVQGKLEARTPVLQPKKRKRKLTEKWVYKDFQIPGI
ncbi:hypothetical protein Egran_04810 [Elaphomyces granulatus]|uniref:Ribosome biogenesis protein NOP53 n=1 Tax=Elaphomyces granulatus TaxID=519963 RepID=A0A232LTL2_9EURO|nr:hypothetical protein Egran_04810 [Elaphomyces granulatus]